ncbi:unnamed protein product [Victoria cruziana]
MSICLWLKSEDSGLHICDVQLCHYMDPNLPSSEVSEERARQTLIRISQTDPAQVLDSNFPHGSPIASNVVEKRDDRKIEEYRLKLISISDIENPEIIANVPSEFETFAS